MKKKIFIIFYLLIMAGITVTVFIFIPFSITAVIVAAAFIINLLLFGDELRKK